MTLRDKQRSGRNLGVLVLAIILILAFAVFFAPKYLVYSDSPVKTDAVVLFIGTDVVSRQNAAVKLIHAGYADYLIVPAYDHIYEKFDQQSLLSAVDVSRTIYSDTGESYPHYYEQTHVEVLKTKKIMDHFGFRKANFVSSPYHMRRVKMITESVFPVKGADPSGYEIRFVSSPLQSPHALLPLWNQRFMKAMVSEYIKIVWFYSYVFLS